MTWAVLATGPSLTQSDVDAVRGLKVIAVSDAYKLAPWADVLYSSDARWFWAHPEAKSFAGLRCCLEEVKGVTRIDGQGLVGENPSNSGFHAVNLAVRYGAKRIVLLGFDMKAQKERTHFFGKHPAQLERPHPYKQWIKNFTALAADLSARGIEVINCTPGSALKCFPKMELADVLQDVRRAAEAA